MSNKKSFYLWQCSVCGEKSHGKHPPRQCINCASEANRHILIGPQKQTTGICPPVCESLPGKLVLDSPLYVVSSTRAGRVNAMCCSSVIQATFYPPRIVVAVNKINLTHDFIKESGAFSVSPLEQKQIHLAHLFGRNSGRQMDKLASLSFTYGQTGSPIIQDCSGYFDCLVDHRATVDLDSHTLFVGRVVDALHHNNNLPLLTYREYIKQAAQIFQPLVN
ncbi:flavin reductase family protein [Desulforamulus hydrothermalis]|uniref:Flavin reductase domain protein, FMN-binding protein n=1 Tax=Desulforamulus hydrothermalis Lam5 = DSM 18033 TaxID=1121428 RepID=K8EKL5_9FIRM|nr:flavin reductase family protein [Desulforamulus hydrothermalis]CCO09091.1 Flavin reductase domain protein, FMN-binding protein [Desulforamulus hydrothermalis Lam5 = DSM 18033]SHG78797.1 NADH-FMN oxidoreductase RutF, flavin reductase (DIM6/NTAB) family [Desulforamulus hydrothermalis Lam5 = DSM 18033]